MLDNRKRLSTVVNNASKFDDGAPTGVTYFKRKKLNGKYECLENIKKGSRKIKVSQDSALVNAFEKFKHIKDSVFYEKNLESNPTICHAVKKDRRKNKDDESDIYQPQQKESNANALGRKMSAISNKAKVKNYGSKTPARNSIKTGEN